ncbi:MAG: 30S ribosomal protein S9 [Planctomycetota bacterium]
MAKAAEFAHGVGRRKTSIARVRVRPGKGSFLINKKESKEFFPSERNINEATSPLKDTQNLEKYDVFVTVQGGGNSGQCGAIRMGLARALLATNADLENTLRQKGHLTRDARMKERKKYGQRGARARFQFSKR